MSGFARRCGRCGDIDKYRRRRAVAKFTVFLVLATGVLLAVYIR